MRTRERLVRRLEDEGIKDIRVLDAIRTTPRHIFVDEALATRAYEDTALPIGHGQTISQPYIVALMTEVLLNSGPLEKVLEIGTGSGYQAAILAAVVPHVYTMERIQPLLSQARQRFHELQLRNIRTQYADGTIGWPEQAPFDGIMATAAPEQIPLALLEQLKVGGRMIIPVGRQGLYQELILVTRNEEGYEQRKLDDVSFVPMLSGSS